MRNLYKLMLLIAFSYLLVGCYANRMNLHEGIQSFKAQDYRRAFILLKTEADKGQIDAQYAVGFMYYYGRGVVEDRKKGWFWINLAASKGQPQAIAAAKILEGHVIIQDPKLPMSALQAPVR